MLRRGLSLTIIVLLVLGVLPLYAPYVNAHSNEGDWIKFDTGVITVVVPTRHVIPIYFWWYDKLPSKVYVAHYYGLAEAWIPFGAVFRHRYLFGKNMTRDIFRRLGLSGIKKVGNLSLSIGLMEKLLDEGDYKDLAIIINKTLSIVENASTRYSDVKDVLNDLVKNLREAGNESEYTLKYYSEYNLTRESILKAASNISTVNITSVLKSYLDRFNRHFNLTRGFIQNITRGKDLIHEARDEINILYNMLNLSTGYGLDNITSAMRNILTEMNKTLSGKPVNTVKLASELSELDTDYISFVNSYTGYAADVCMRVRSALNDLNRYMNGEVGYGEASSNINITISILVKIKYPSSDIQGKVDSITNQFRIISRNIGRYESIKKKLYTAREKVRMLLSSISMDAEELRRRIIQHYSDIFMHFMDVMRRIREAVMKMHPPFLPFAMCGWMFKGPENITTPDGKVIGVEFSFVLKTPPRLIKIPEVKRVGWSWLREGDIVIRNRLYYVAVNETIGNQTYTVTRAELKNDIVIKHWMWNYDVFKSIFGNYTWIPELKPRLILISRFGLGRFKISQFENITEVISGDKGLGFSQTVVIRHGNMRLQSNMSMKREFEYDMNATRHFPILIISPGENTTIAGFYRFNPEAYIRHRNVTEAIKVHGVFWLTNRHLTVFLVYPYFNNWSLEHDPSIGVSGVSSEKPEYNITYENGAPEVIAPTNETIVNPPGNETVVNPPGNQSIVQPNLPGSQPSPKQSILTVNRDWIVIAVLIAVIIAAAAVFIIKRR